jgi:uncharacterized OB-fold protein
MSNKSTTATPPPPPAHPAPARDPLTAGFWEGCQHDSLLLGHCRDCDHCFLPHGPCCPRCWSADIDSQAASGRGRVKTFTVYRHGYHPALPPPYVVAIVQLDEGPRMVSNVVGAGPETVRTGMEVRVFFEQAGDVKIPRFEPAVEEDTHTRKTSTGKKT